jgi:GT2 family glycosyltransferase
LLLNPDVRLHPGAGRELRAALGGPSIGIAAPRTLDGGGNLSPVLRHEPSVSRALAEALFGARRAGARGWGEAVLDPRAYERPMVADWASGATLMISRECLTACGPWDESFFLYSEDTEYALRARDHGFRVALAPGATATHLGGESRTDPSLWSLLVTNKVLPYARRRGRARGLVFRCASLLRELRFALTGNRPSRAAARALLGGSGPHR